MNITCSSDSITFGPAIIKNLFFNSSKYNIYITIIN
jgi:hypothetical protein